MYIDIQYTYSHTSDTTSKYVQERQNHPSLFTLVRIFLDRAKLEEEGKERENGAEKGGSVQIFLILFTVNSLL